jgi:flagellar hook-associated protein 3 FlgL
MAVTNVSTAYFFQHTKFGLARVQAQLDEAQRQMSTGTKVADLAQAGADAAPIIGARDMMSRVNARIDALKSVEPRLEAQDLALGRAASVAASLKLDALKAVTTDVGAGLADRLQEAFSVAVTEMNAQWNGRFMFGGERIDQAPVVVADLTALAAVANGQAAFDVAQRTQVLGLGDGFSVSVAERGVDIGATLFDGMRDLKVLLDAYGGALGKPLTPAQKAALEAIVNKLAQADSELTQAQSRNGSLQNRVARELEISDSRAVLLEKTIGEAVDADLGQVSITLSQLRTQYQASASTFANLRDLNLMNYLR